MAENVDRAARTERLYTGFVCREMSQKDGHIQGTFDGKEGVVYLPSRNSHKWTQNTVEIRILCYVVVQFYPWLKFYFLLFLGMVMYGNDFETKENKI